MRSILVVISCLLAFALPAAAQTYTVGDTTPSSPETINFNGMIDGTVVNGLTSSLTYLLLSMDDNADGTMNWTFEMTVDNTSDTNLVDASAITAVGFNVGPDPISYAAAITNDGYFIQISEDALFPSIGTFDLCVHDTQKANKCQGAGSGADGLQIDGGTETFYLQLTVPIDYTSITLSDFVVRYKGVTTDTLDGASAEGLVTIIPEPATWLMMIIGFGIVSASTRRTRHKENLAHS